MVNEGLQLYLIEAKKHQQQYKLELDELRIDLLADNFKGRDYRATERLLQIFTELCIGLAKHWLKGIQRSSTSEAYQTFSLLKKHNQISSENLALWKKIIGLRNGLVHDYLNIDLLIVERIIKEQHYLQLEEFANKAILHLQTKNNEA
ncbi:MULTISPECIES: type VII toxin-antitoxin system HepT family RNase toxin [Colwellia]|uniref:DUF86 domain-containing protein n=1 Tax=Colwellia marinimaniae TaxID=1513592 RepID=A0ABQ0MZP3_9GAMM|nr:MULTISPECIES: DUF86 domain-containing protein [Colwellia]GAW97794.1 hypothetical protein MTCD1_03438 [Colwellia marinimaniae]